jgi:carboxyl-terminal processing protease
MKIKSVYTISFLAIIMLASTAFYVPTDKYFEISRNLDIFASLFKEVNAFYVDEIDPEKSIRTGIDAMLASLDPYTNYIPEEDMAAYRTMTTGEYGGIGSLIGEINGKIMITMPNEGFPAHKAGIKIGDEIVNIDGVEVEGKTTNDVSKLLKGTAGTDINLTIKRQGELIEFNLTRAKIIIDNVPYHGLVKEDIGYIRLAEFTTNAAKEVKDALVDLKKEGATKIILDVRGNPGGILQEAVAICNLFIPQHMVVVETKGKTPNWNKVYRTTNRPVDTDIPLVVLTSSGSASAAEIVSGTIQDYDRGVLIGRKTFGKGLVQTTRPLGYDSQVKITVAKYYTPSGRCIQAIDYSHRNPDGSIGKIPDSLMVAFKTSNGRTVYDGGGITPDVEVDPEYFSSLSVNLLTNGSIFNYANNYYYHHPEVPDMKGFVVTDETYADFIKYLDGVDLKYDGELEQAVRIFEKAAKKSTYYDALKSDIEALKKEVAHNQVEDLAHFKQEISDVLAEQIVSRYYLAKGEIANSITHDPDITKAVEVLNDTTQYRQLLAKNL